MFLKHQSFFRATFVAVVGISLLATPVLAESVNIEGLPPQPEQLTLPEDPVASGAQVNVVADQKSIPEQPTSSLNELQSEPAMMAPETQLVPHSGTYYDSSSIGPSSLGASAGPRKVDPKYEPGSSFVVVRKNASSSSRQANIVAAQRALRLGRYSAALELYEGLYKRNPKNKQILMGLAVAQQYNGFIESSIATYEELLKIAPHHTGAMVNLMGLLEQRQPDVALRKLQDLWNKNGRNPAIAAQLGLVNAKINDYEASSRYLGIAASLEPNNPVHYYNLAIVLDQSNSHKSAIEYYQKALEVDVSHDGGRAAIPREEIYDRLAQLRRL